MLADLVPQRWGIGSTRLHLDAEQLAVGVLLFDRLVLPTPSDVDEADRWDSLGWDTRAHARRIVQLGELVHFAPWDERLREDWRSQWERLRRLGQESRDLAYSMTPMVIAQSAWQDVMTSADGTYGPGVRPVPVVWAPDSRGLVGAEARPGPPTPTEPYEDVAALRFRTLLEQPARAHPEETLDAALTLADTADFQDARRALHQAQALAAAAQLPPEEFGELLDGAVTAYNQVVADHAGATRRRAVHGLLPTVAGGAVQLAGLPGSAVARWSVQRVVGRLIPLPPRPEPAGDAGSAIALTQRAMAAVWTGTDSGS